MEQMQLHWLLDVKTLHISSGVKKNLLFSTAATASVLTEDYVNKTYVSCLLYQESSPYCKRTVMWFVRSGNIPHDDREWALNTVSVPAHIQKYFKVPSVW